MDSATTATRESGSPVLATYVFKIRGMDCAEEAAILRRALGKTVAEEALAFDVIQAKMSVTVPQGQVSEKDIIDTVATTGLKAVPWDSAGAESQRETWWGVHGRTALCIVSAVALAAAFAIHTVASGVWSALTAETIRDYPMAAVALYAVAIVCSAWLYTPKAWFALRHFRPDINVLVLVAATGAVILGNWFEAATVSFLFAIAIMLESWSVGRARRAITALMDLTPAKARYRCPHDGDIEEKPVADVPVGVTVLVRPGDRIPLDGTVTLGETTVNEAPITGESAPVAKKGGDTVFAGTVNNEGAIEFRVDKAAQDTTLARIIHMVEEAQSRRAPSEQWVQQFARYYTPAMMALAIAVAIVPPLVTGGSWSYWFYESLVVLLIACPCALVISTPVSIVSGLASAARHGVLIKGGAYLEVPAKLKVVAMDKTGTLTYGRPAVKRVLPFNGHTDRELVRRAAAVESLSSHPLAKAIVQHARDESIAFERAESYTAVTGKGAEATVEGRSFWVGNESMSRVFGDGKRGEVEAQAALLEHAGDSVVLMGTGDHICGLITLSDAIRPESVQAIRAMRKAGIQHIVMLTGDNRGTAEALAEQAGLTDFHAELLPEDKVRRVRELRETYGAIAMIGDGVNDAPAMAESGLGIAMGAAGTDAAIETADVALMSDDLTKVAWLIQHSKRTMRIIRQNVVIALGLKVLVFGLALGGMATLWLAVLSDMGASLLVIFNGLRLLRDPAGRP